MMLTAARKSGIITSAKPNVQRIFYFLRPVQQLNNGLFSTARLFCLRCGYPPRSVWRPGKEGGFLRFKSRRTDTRKVRQMATSKLQEQIKYRLRALFDGYEFAENYYPAWLVNPETGKLMELDFWLPEAKIAVEVQGRQHYEYVPHFHGTIENFHKQLERDRVKKETCKNNGVLLWEVYELPDIDRHLKEAGLHSKNIIKQIRKKSVALNALGFFAAELQRETSRGVTRRGRKLSRRKKAYNTPNEAKIEKLTRNIMILCERYGIPLKSVAPDDSIKRIEIMFPRNPIVKIKLIEVVVDEELGTTKEVTIRKSKAAIVKVKNNGRVVIARWLSRPQGYSPRWMEREFDLWGSMTASGHYGRYWRLKADSIPPLSDYPHLFEASE